MRFTFIQAEDGQQGFSVASICRVLRVSTSGYYAWCGREPSKRTVRKQALVAKVKATHAASRGTYGSPRVTQELKQSGERVSEKTIAQIMRENELVARKKRQFKTTTHSKHTQRIADNLLQRNFSACAPNKIWVTDVTAVWTLAGWAYLAEPQR